MKVAEKGWWVVGAEEVVVLVEEVKRAVVVVVFPVEEPEVIPVVEVLADPLKHWKEVPLEQPTACSSEVE